MGLIEPLKINYDNFYKFVISFSMILFLISIGITSYMVVNQSFFGIFYLPIASFYIILGIVSVYFFFWAILKWYNNQKLMDKKLKKYLEDQNAL